MHLRIEGFEHFRLCGFGKLLMRSRKNKFTGWSGCLSGLNGVSSPLGRDQVNCVRPLQWILFHKFRDKI